MRSLTKLQTCILLTCLDHRESVSSYGIHPRESDTGTWSASRSSTKSQSRSSRAETLTLSASDSALNSGKASLPNCREAVSRIRFPTVSAAKSAGKKGCNNFQIPFVSQKSWSLSLPHVQSICALDEVCQFLRAAHCSIEYSTLICKLISSYFSISDLSSCNQK